MARTWIDRIVQFPRKFIITNNGDGTVTIDPSVGTITQTGTPVNATNLNGLEVDVTAVTNTVNMHLNDNVKHITATERTTWNAKATATDLVDLKQYTTLKSGKDSNSIYTTYQRKRYDRTLLMQSVLSGGTSPLYTTRTETWYAADGTTAVSTRAYAITYDSDGLVTSEV